METFPIIENVELPADLNYEIGRFGNDEARKFYIRERRKNCTFMQIMNLWLVAPLCYSCALDESFDGIIWPYIESKKWQKGIQDYAGLTVLRRTKRELRLDPDFAYICKKCGTQLRPWNGDQMSITRLHLEEHFDIPLETPGHRNPSTAVKKLIERLYGNRCFGCNRRKTAKVKLHIDHIVPRSKGGTSAFRNLQPLCECCGNKKANKMPSELEVYSIIFFGPYPSDSYEGLFW